MNSNFPLWESTDLTDRLASAGFVVTLGSQLRLDGPLKQSYLNFLNSWSDLPVDRDLPFVDGKLNTSNIYRYRRYGRFRFRISDYALQPLPHEPFFQSHHYNKGAGGRMREFAPLTDETFASPFLQTLIRSNFHCLPLTGEHLDRQREEWDIYVHQIRVVATPDLPGKPAPEGIHQDDVEFFTVHLLKLQNCTGGDSQIYDLDQRPIKTLRLKNPLDTLFVDDKQVMHGVTPIHPENQQQMAFRDVLILSFRHPNQ